MASPMSIVQCHPSFAQLDSSHGCLSTCLLFIYTQFRYSAEYMPQEAGQPVKSRAFTMATSMIRAPTLLTVPSFLYLLSDDLQILFLSLWLDVRSLATLDVAVSSHGVRLIWMTLLQRLRSPAVDGWGHSLSSLMWLSRRGIRASRVQMKIDTSRVHGSDILLLDTSNIVALSLRGCCNIRDLCVMDVVSRCPKLKSIDLWGCRAVTDAGISALGVGCSQLRDINLSHCGKVSDAGVSALGAGCGKLQSIDLSNCDQVTDVGVSALGAGCGQLRSIDLRGCNKVTDAGVSALGAGCGQLWSISLSCCVQVTDAGVSALGAGCGQLQSINLSSCNEVTDAGVSALGAGCGKLQSIDLRGCDKVTDAGVSAVGAGCGQLQSISLSCCVQVTDAGVSALGASFFHTVVRCQMQVYQRWVQDAVS